MWPVQDQGKLLKCVLGSVPWLVSLKEASRWKSTNVLKLGSCWHHPASASDQNATFFLKLHEKYKRVLIGSGFPWPLYCMTKLYTAYSGRDKLGPLRAITRELLPLLIYLLFPSFNRTRKAFPHVWVFNHTPVLWLVISFRNVTIIWTYNRRSMKSSMINKDNICCHCLLKCSNQLLTALPPIRSPVRVIKCPWARHWTTSRSWWACWHFAWQPLPSLCVNGWMLACAVKFFERSLDHKSAVWLQSPWLMLNILLLTMDPITLVPFFWPIILVSQLFMKSSPHKPFNK